MYLPIPSSLPPLQLGNYTGGLHWCDLALENDPDNVDILCDRAELHINEQKYEEAIKDYQRAAQVENHPRKVRVQGQYYFPF